ncbi:hypothetical protein LguiB_017796 [Lonicera macranthoides]
MVNDRFQHNSSDAQSMLQVNSRAHVLRAFVNETLVGSAHGSKKNTNFTLESSVSLTSGMNDISLLSVMVGLPDSGAFLERKIAGVRSVKIQTNQQIEDFTNYTWGYQVGLWGEKLQIYTDEGSGNVQWNSFESSQPLSWYKTVFDAPEGNEPLALNLSPMGKGEAWINGQSIGRYWISFRTPNGSPSQTWYNVPRSFLKSTGNLLVLLDEEYGNPLDITLDTVSVTEESACGSGWVGFKTIKTRTRPEPAPGWFVDNGPGKYYEGGLIENYDYYNMDLMSMHKVDDMIQQLGHSSPYDCYMKTRITESWLKVDTDCHLLSILNLKYAKSSIAIYVNHKNQAIEPETMANLLGPTTVVDNPMQEEQLGSILLCENRAMDENSYDSDECIDSSYFIDTNYRADDILFDKNVNLNVE